MIGGGVNFLLIPWISLEIVSELVIPLDNPGSATDVYIHQGELNYNEIICQNSCLYYIHSRSLQ